MADHPKVFVLLEVDEEDFNETLKGVYSSRKLAKEAQRQLNYHTGQGIQTLVIRKCEMDRFPGVGVSR